MKAKAIRSAITPGPLDDFRDWLMTGRAFRKPVAFENIEAAREVLRFSRREWKEITLPGGRHVWFEVEAAFALAGGTARVRR